ncbi:MAG: YdeI/OmpD-associated family protein [Pseudomonadota bacterium]
MSEFFTHEFSSDIREFGVGKSRKVWYRVVFLPQAMESDLPFERFPRLRVDGEVADIPVNGAWIPAGDGRRYLILSPTVLKAARLKVGDMAHVRFRVADQDHVDVPQALLDEINQRPKEKKVWEGLTAGKKRALAFHVAGAKREDTIQRRVAEAMEAISERNGQIRKPRA